MPPLPTRKPNRLQEYDYSSPGAYFVTICTQGRTQTLGRIPTLGEVIGWYKYTVTIQANSLLGTTGQQRLQRSFHDRVVRNAAKYRKIWDYIETKPARWHEDCFYTENG